MGFPAIAVDGCVPPFHLLVEQGTLQSPVFSFWMNRDPNSHDGGELVLGGMDDAHYSGDHTWCVEGWWCWGLGVGGWEGG